MAPRGTSRVRCGEPGGDVLDVCGVGAVAWDKARRRTLLMDAVETVLEQGVKTRDLGGQAGTEEVTSKVCEEILRLGKERAFFVKGKEVSISWMSLDRPVGLRLHAFLRCPSEQPHFLRGSNTTISLHPATLPGAAVNPCSHSLQPELS